MKYLLDTHILLWWYLDSPKLPKRYADVLDQAEEKQETLGVSIISLWEIAELSSRGKITTSIALDQWFEHLENDPLIDLLPLDAGIILDSNRLGADFPKDPADQLIAATARNHGMQLMTVDRKMTTGNKVAIV